MNSHILGKTKDAVMRQALIPSATILCARNGLNQTALTCPKVQACEREEYRTGPLKQPCILQYTPTAPSSRFSDINSNEHVLLFGGDDQTPNQDKVLALSKMFDNILREMPRLLDNHDYTIYTDDLEFISHLPILRTVHGRQSYKVGLTAWFSSISLLYTDLYIDILEAIKEKDHVSVRWGICGNSRLNHSFNRVFDGTSTFYPEDSGLIKTHILDKVAVDKWRLYQTVSNSIPTG